MGFFSKLKKALPYIEKGAVIAGQAKDNPVGAALATVELITEQGGDAEDASKALAVAVDDHEERMVAMEKDFKKLRSELDALKKKVK
jgi:hypothetical protein